MLSSTSSPIPARLAGAWSWAVPESVKAALCSALRTGQMAIAERLTRAQGDGQLPLEANVEALASYFNTVISGLGVQAKGGAGAETLRDVVDAAVLVLPG
jgi:TetR/AcrR family transcriptional regulator, copper-responsive repressor